MSAAAFHAAVPPRPPAGSKQFSRVQLQSEYSRLRTGTLALRRALVQRLVLDDGRAHGSLADDGDQQQQQNRRVDFHVDYFDLLLSIAGYFRSESYWNFRELRKNEALIGKNENFA